MTPDPLHARSGRVRPAPPILTHAGPLLANYDVVLCDVWGVLHDGHHAFPEAGPALARFRAGGGTVVLVSNAPVPGESVASLLDATGVRRDTWDAIVTSGDIVAAHVVEKGYRRLHRIGPEDRDGALFERLGTAWVPLDVAEAILCTGFDREDAMRASVYQPLLERALRRDVPFVCANPDLVVDVGGTLYPCAGAIAELYERMGGAVFWAGKPHAIAFATAQARAGRLRGEPVGRDRLIAIGDSIRTDIAGAHAAGIQSLFVASGIHREDIVSDGALSAEAVARLFAPPAPVPAAVMRELAW